MRQAAVTGDRDPWVVVGQEMSYRYLLAALVESFESAIVETTRHLGPIGPMFRPVEVGVHALHSALDPDLRSTQGRADAIRATAPDVYTFAPLRMTPARLALIERPGETAPKSA